MSRTKNITTPQDFAFFESEVRRWCDRLGVHDWDVRCVRERLDGNYAQVHYDFQSRKALISLSESFSEHPVTKDKLSDSAMHEVLHIVLADLSAYAGAAGAKSRVEEAEHAALYRLKRALQSGDDRTRSNSRKR